MPVRRIWRSISAVLVVSVLAQILPGVLDLPQVVPQAHADPIAPIPPPPAVTPVPSMRVVESAGPTLAPTQISNDTVWGPQGSPYIVRGGLSGMSILRDASPWHCRQD